MNRKSSTKRALFSSLIMLMLCVSMMLGTTYAWFSDSVTSGNNIIASGDLKVQLEYSKDGKTWNTVNATTAVFDDEQAWEPGMTQAVALRVRNIGTLELKYKLNTAIVEEIVSTNTRGDKLALSEHLQLRAELVSDANCNGEYISNRLSKISEVNSTTLSELRLFDFNQDFKTGLSSKSEAVDMPLLPSGEITAESTDIYIFAINLPAEANSVTNYASDAVPPSVKFGINLYATQYSNSSDSFGSDYDEQATYEITPQVSVTHLDEDNVNVSGNKVDIDKLCKFDPVEDSAEAKESKYKDYRVDYVIYANNPIPENALKVVGICDGYNDSDWITYTNDSQVEAYEAIRLFKSANAGYPTYLDICRIDSSETGLQCGIKQLKEMASSTTVTVELRLYELDENGQENGQHFVVGAFKQTF